MYCLIGQLIGLMLLLAMSAGDAADGPVGDAVVYAVMQIAFNENGTLHMCVARDRRTVPRLATCLVSATILSCVHTCVLLSLFLVLIPSHDLLLVTHLGVVCVAKRGCKDGPPIRAR